jgi:ubiquinone/menaquinone biosynthesis C-methylase UbiE
MQRLNLGSGDERITGFLSVDILPGPNIDIVVDLEKLPWDIPSASVEYVRAYHVFEHLSDKAATLNECYRILVNGGILEFEVPTTDGWGAYSDPQHASYWNEDVLNYISASRNNLVYSYGKKSGLRCNFDIEHYQLFEMRHNVFCMNCRLRKVPMV